MFFGAVFTFLARRPLGRRLLLAHPRLFSCGVFTRKGPSEAQMAETSFVMAHFASGYARGAPPAPSAPPDARVATRVEGPEPGYVACAIFVVAAAATLLEERERLGVPPGVHTPAWLLHNTTYVDRLRARGVAFERVGGGAA